MRKKLLFFLTADALTLWAIHLATQGNQGIANILTVLAWIFVILFALSLLILNSISGSGDVTEPRWSRNARLAMDFVGAAIFAYNGWFFHAAAWICSAMLIEISRPDVEGGEHV